MTRNKENYSQTAGNPEENDMISTERSYMKKTNPEIERIGQSLINGESPSSVDPKKCKAVHSYLRNYKREILQIPDYTTAHRIDEINNELTLIINKNSYCGFKSAEVRDANQKLQRAKRELQRVLEEREKFFKTFQKQKNISIKNLEEKQAAQLNEHDKKYNEEMPAKYRKLSPDILNMRRKEKMLRNSKRYKEAQKLHEECDALEAYELARQKVRFHNEGVEARQLIVAQHQQQMKCLLEKQDRQFQTIMPSSYEAENHWRIVIDHLENQIKRFKGESKDVKKATQTMLTKDRGLPSLGRPVPKSTLTRVNQINNQKTYTRYGASRANSTFK